MVVLKYTKMSLMLTLFISSLSGSIFVKCKHQSSYHQSFLRHMSIINRLNNANKMVKLVCHEKHEGIISRIRTFV